MQLANFVQLTAHPLQSIQTSEMHINPKYIAYSLYATALSFELLHKVASFSHEIKTTKLTEAL